MVDSSIPVLLVPGPYGGCPGAAGRVFLDGYDAILAWRCHEGSS